MYSPLPLEWDKLIRSGAQRRTVVDVYADPAVSAITLSDIPVEDWQVTVDRNSDIRRTATVKIVDEDLTAELIREKSSLDPYGSEIHIKTGFRLDDGSFTYVPLGVFQIEDLDWNQDEIGVSLHLNDRSRSLQRSLYGLPFDAAGKDAVALIQDILQDLLPYVSFVSSIAPANNIRLPGGTSYRNGRLAAIQDIAQALGAEFFFDTDGVARLVPVPFIDTTVYDSDYDWLVNTGTDGVLVSYTRQISRRDTFNRIHVLGAPATKEVPQPYALAADDNPGSPTYQHGRFGQSDKTFERQELTTDGQCMTYALAQLRNSIGLSKSLGFNSLANPALEEGDTVLVEYPDGTQELHLVDGKTEDQTGGMKISTRTRFS